MTGNGWLHFDRTADTLLQALTSAIRDVESSGLIVCAVAGDDLVSLKDIAARTYESARLPASGKRGPGGFPPPVTTADGWSLYSWAQVSQWLRTNPLTPGPQCDMDPYRCREGLSDSDKDPYRGRFTGGRVRGRGGLVRTEYIS